MCPTRIVEIIVESTDPELLTLKAVRKLQQADAILFDESIPPAIVQLGRREAVKICLCEGDPLAAGLAETWRLKGNQVIILKSRLGAVGGTASNH